MILGHCPPFKIFLLEQCYGSWLCSSSDIIGCYNTDRFLITFFFFIVALRTISGLVQCKVGVILAWYLKVLTSIPIIAINIKNEK